MAVVSAVADQTLFSNREPLELNVSVGWQRLRCILELTEAVAVVTYTGVHRILSPYLGWSNSVLV